MLMTVQTILRQYTNLSDIVKMIAISQVTSAVGSHEEYNFI